MGWSGFVATELLAWRAALMRAFGYDYGQFGEFLRSAGLSAFWEKQHRVFLTRDERGLDAPEPADILRFTVLPPDAYLLLWQQAANVGDVGDFSRALAEAHAEVQGVYDPWARLVASSRTIREAIVEGATLLNAHSSIPWTPRDDVSPRELFLVRGPWFRGAPPPTGAEMDLLAAFQAVEESVEWVSSLEETFPKLHPRLALDERLHRCVADGLTVFGRPVEPVDLPFGGTAAVVFDVREISVSNPGADEEANRLERAFLGAGIAYGPAAAAVARHVRDETLAGLLPGVETVAEHFGIGRFRLPGRLEDAKRAFGEFPVSANSGTSVLRRMAALALLGHRLRLAPTGKEKQARKDRRKLAARWERLLGGPLPSLDRLESVSTDPLVRLLLLPGNP